MSGMPKAGLRRAVISGGDMRVRASFVAGRPLVENGRIPWLDLDALGAEALAAVQTIARKA